METALVGRKCLAADRIDGRGLAVIDRGAARQERERPGWTAIVGQRTEHGVNGLGRRSHQVARPLEDPDAQAAIADEVMAQVVDFAWWFGVEIRVAERVGVTRDQGVDERQIVGVDAASNPRSVAGDGVIGELDGGVEITQATSFTRYLLEIDARLEG